MNTEVYYFSGTGNSLYAATKIGELNNYKVFSIPEIMKKEEIIVQSERIVLVFPSYLAAAFGVPAIVESFVKKMQKIELKKISAVCTCGGYETVNANPSLIKLDKIIKSAGGKLESRFSLRLPMNNLDYEHIPVPIEKRTEVILEKAERKIVKISASLHRRKNRQFNIANSLFYCCMIPVFSIMKNATLASLRLYSEADDESLNCTELMQLTDRSIKINDNCTGCGVCARICPVGNIEIKDRKPEFKHRCEACLACDEWCPQEAVQHWSRAAGVKYHHPRVRIEDMSGW